MAIFNTIAEVWSAIMEWMVGVFPQIETLFWTVGEGGAVTLTLIGSLCVISLGISIFFLCLGLIQKFLHLRG